MKIVQILSHQQAIYGLSYDGGVYLLNVFSRSWEPVLESEKPPVIEVPNV